MKTLTIELGLEKGDTSMDDTVECRVNFPIPEEDMWHGDDVVATFEFPEDLSYKEALVIAKKIQCRANHNHNEWYQTYFTCRWDF